MLRIPVTRHIHTNAYEQARRLRLYIPGSAALRPYLRGDGGIRTLDPLLARQVLSQLSYTPIRESVFCFLHPLNGLFHYQISLALGLSGPLLFYPQRLALSQWA